MTIEVVWLNMLGLMMKSAEEFMKDHQDIYPRIKISHGLRPDYTRMLEGYYKGGKRVM